MTAFFRLGAVAALVAVSVFGLPGTIHADGFSAPRKWQDFFSIGNEVPLVGDFNGDGIDDIVTFVRNNRTDYRRGDVWVALSNGVDGFVNPERWHGWFCINTEVCKVGDFNGDGYDDIYAFVRDSKGGDEQGNVWVALSNGQDGFCDSRIRHTSFCTTSDFECLVGDFDGDGADDIASVDDRSTVLEGHVTVATSNRDTFNFAHIWALPQTIWNHKMVRVGDVDGDGRDDLINFVRNSNLFKQGDVYVHFSRAVYGRNYFTHSDIPQHPWFGINGELPETGDFNADGASDIITFLRSGPSQSARRGDVWVGLQHSDFWNSSFTSDLWHHSFGYGNEVVLTGKFNRDNRDDIVAFVRDDYPSGRGDVWVALSEVAHAPVPLKTGELGRGNRSPPSLTGTLPVVVILMDVANAGWEQADPLQYWEDSFKGVPGAPSFRGYMDSISHGALDLDPIDVYGPYTYPGTFSEWEDVEEAGGSQDAFVKTAIDAAVLNGVDFDIYDADANGTIENDEMRIIIIFNQSGSKGGCSSGFKSVPCQGGQANCWVNLCSSRAGVDPGETVSFQLLMHEFLHTLGSYDTYTVGSDDDEKRGILDVTGTSTGTAANTTTTQLALNQKNLLGWGDPRYATVRGGGCVELAPRDEANAWGVALVDAIRGPSQVFYLESRQPNSSTYDTKISDGEGLQLTYHNGDARGLPFGYNHQRNEVFNGYAYRRSTWTVSAERPGEHVAYLPYGQQPWGEVDGTISPLYCDYDISVFTVGYLGCTDPSLLRIRVGDATPTRDLQVEWGQRRLPVANIDSVSPTSATPGDAVAIYGVFGTKRVTEVNGQPVERGAVLRQRRDNNQNQAFYEAEYDAGVIWGACNEALLVVPLGIPSGDYQVLIWEEYSYEDNTFQVVTERRYGTWALLEVL